MSDLCVPGDRSSSFSLIGGQNERLDARTRITRSKSPTKTSILPPITLVQVKTTQKRRADAENLGERKKRRIVDTSKDPTTKPSATKTTSNKPSTTKTSTKLSTTKTTSTKAPSKRDSTSERASTGSTLISPDDIHVFVKATMRDKIFGLMVGSAASECVGLYTEYMTKEEAATTYPGRKFSLTESVTDSGWLGDRALLGTNVWTDGTNQALCILLDFLHTGDLQIKNFALRLYDLAVGDTPASGGTPYKSGPLGRLICLDNFTIDPIVTSYEAWKHDPEGPFSGASNESLTRCHPLGAICVFKSLHRTFEIATGFCIVTHPSPKCIVACCIVVGLIRGILLGEVRVEDHIDAMIRDAVRWVDDWTSSRRTQLADKRRKGAKSTIEPRLDHSELVRYVRPRIATLIELKLEEKRTPGYVYVALGATIYTLRSATDGVKTLDYDEMLLINQGGAFDHLITDIVMEGSDATANACTVGAILGAYFGYRAVPQDWRYSLKHGDFLKERIDGLCQTLSISDGDYDGMQDLQTKFDGGEGIKPPRKTSHRGEPLVQDDGGDEPGKKASKKPPKKAGKVLAKKSPEKPEKDSPKKPMKSSAAQIAKKTPKKTPKTTPKTTPKKTRALKRRPNANTTMRDYL